MSTAASHTPLTPAEYLAIERDLDTKHEFYQGEMFAMSGASRKHNLVSFGIALSVGDQLRNRKCEAYTNDMRVKISPTGLYTYPDVIVTCDDPQFEDDCFDTLLNPQVIFEVLSESTEEYDRGKKFEHYRAIASLRDYVLVAQDRPHVEHFSRQPEGGWLLIEHSGLAAEVTLASIGCNLRLADIYARLEF